MKKFTIISLAAIAAATTFTACNSDSPTYETEIVSNVGVRSFKLTKNDSVLANLDTVFFTIDLNKALIFNADSLPYGTRTDTLVPVISMMDAVSKMELRVPKGDGTDSVYDYLESQTHVIDFSKGPVKLYVKSQYSDLDRTYTISVNVHKEKSDSLAWGETARTDIPTLFQNITSQRTVRTADATYCLTSDGSSYCMSKRADATQPWESYNVTLPQNALPWTFAATDDALYILAQSALYRSADSGLTWSDTGIAMNHIYGAYGNRLIGNVDKDGARYSTEYPASELKPLPEGMPVEGTSPTISYSFKLGEAPIMTFIGGRDADDNLSADTWAFDGSDWARITTAPLPDGLEEMCLVPYFTFTVNSVFVATEHSVFLAFGGTDGEVNNRTVYISSDFGRTWKKGGESIQFPSYIPALRQAQALVETLTLGSRSADEWIRFAPEYRAATGTSLMPFASSGSRATEPVTTWECPYIYLYGGYSDGDVPSSYIWRGTLNRFSFKPII